MKRMVMIAVAGCAVMAGGWMSAEHAQPEGVQMPDMDQMFAMMEAASKPDDPHHAHLKRMEGTWKMKASFVMDPNSPPDVSHGTCTNKLVLDGRQLLGEVKLDMKIMGKEMKFNGISLMGYDKITGQFQSTWTDTMGTGQMRQVGTMDGDAIVVEGESVSMMGKHTLKNVIRFVDGGYDMEFWEKGDMVGPEFMNTGKIEYRR